MKSDTKKPKKVRTTISLTKEAQDILFDFGYASERTVGEFISPLIVDYHASRRGTLTPAQIAAEIHRLVDMLAKGSSES